MSVSTQRRVRSFLLIVGLLLLALPVRAQEPAIVIGTSLPLTGDFSINGERHAQGYQLCVDELNANGGLLGRPVELRVTDNESSVDLAVEQHERFITADQVDLLFGTYSSRLTLPTSAVAAEYGMVLPIPAGAALRIYEQGFDNLFYFQALPAEFIGNTPLEAALNLVRSDDPDAPRTVAVVHANDFFANAIAVGLLGGQVVDPDGAVVTELPSLVREAGLELIYNETWPADGYGDWRQMASSLKRTDADILFAMTASAEEVIQLTQAMQEVNYQPRMVYYSQGTQPEFLAAVGAAAEGVTTHTGWNPLVNRVGLLGTVEYNNADFVEAYASTYGGALPDEDVAVPFAVCQGMAQAVAAVGSTDNAALRDWLHTRTDADPVRTILGDYYWDERGLVVDRTFLLVQWQDGELEIVYPVGEFDGTRTFIYPRPEW